MVRAFTVKSGCIRALANGEYRLGVASGSGGSSTSAAHGVHRDDGTSSIDREIAEVERRAQEVDLLRRRVLNVIPHALRTPITTFRGLTESMEQASEEEIRSTIAPALRRLAAQAEHLLDDMLLAAGITTALPTGEPTPTSVTDTVRAVWAGVAPGRPAVSIEGEDVEVRAPQGSLFKIFVHLLDNAAKYGGDEPVVRLRVEGERAVITIDSPGEPVPDVEMLGEPFFRGERAVMGSAGLGVGLAVSRALAEHAGGTLTIAPREGGGLVTSIELDVA